MASPTSLTESAATVEEPTRPVASPRLPAVPRAASAPPVVREPPAGRETPTEDPSNAITQRIPAVGEPCPQCASPLAHDQRYCLRCGAPRTYLGGLVQGRRPTLAAAPPRPPEPPMPPSSASGANANLLRPNTLLAAIGVLLLAMGVGVLIGRSGGGSGKALAPQVISVPASTAAPASSAEESPGEEASAKSSSKHKAAKKKKEAESSGSGSSITKPAPPSAAKELRSGGSGASYEQKSKNLPNVISTG